MADFPTVQTPQLGIEDQLGAATNRLFVPGLGASAYWDPPNFPVPLTRAPAGIVGVTDGSRSGTRMAVFSLSAVSTAFSAWGVGASGLALTREVNRRALAAAEINFQTQIESEAPGGLGLAVNQEWFEKTHIFPGSLALGNLLSSQIRTIELYNAFRRPREPVTWQTFVNNAGAGVTITNLPGLPLVLASGESFIANVQVSTAGPPVINGTLDFTFGPPTSGTFEVLVTGNRITMFQYRPQAPIKERLEFKTDILKLFGGTEQRIKVRAAPRSIFDFEVRVDDGRSRDAINAVLFDWQARVFGVPVWAEAKPLGAPIAVNDLVVTVDTADADYRVDGLVMFYDSDFYFEALEIGSFTANSITVKTGVSKIFDGLSTIVMPVKTAFTKPQLSNGRFAIGPADYKIQFETIDNIDLSDVGTFTTYQGTGQTVAKPVLDDLNFMQSATIGEGNRTKIFRMDTKVGPPVQYSPWIKGKPFYRFGYHADTQAEVWAWRKLMHFLRGSQLAFYLPTGRRDFKPLLDIGDGGGAIDFPNYGWTNFVASITPRADLRILRKDGTSSLHQITGSSVITDDIERLQVAPGISPALLAADVERMEVLSLSRITDDTVNIEHQRPGTALLQIQTTGVPS